MMTIDFWSNVETSENILCRIVSFETLSWTRFDNTGAKVLHDLCWRSGRLTPGRQL